MTGWDAWSSRIRSRWQKWRRDPAGFAADLPSPALRGALLFGLAGVTVGFDLLDGRDRRAARAWRRSGVTLAKAASHEGVYHFVAGTGAVTTWPDCLLIEDPGLGMVVVARADDGERLTAVQLAPGRPGLVWLGRRPAQCIVYRTDGWGLPQELRVRPVSRGEAVRGLRRRGLGFADALKAVWPLLEPGPAAPDRQAYRRWIDRNEPGAGELDAVRSWLARLGSVPRVNILMNVFDPRPSHLKAALDSVRAQSFGDWRLWILDEGSHGREVLRLLKDASGADPRVDVGQAEASPVEGEVVMRLAPDAVLAPHALAMVAGAFAEHPEVIAVYSDEDRIDGAGRRSAPVFKTDLDRERLEGGGDPGDLLAVRAGGDHAIDGRLRPGWRHALMQVLALHGEGRVLRLAHVLHHSRAVRGPAAAPRPSPPAPAAEAGPRLLAIVPTRDRPDLLEACVTGLLEQTDYAGLELCIVDNGSRSAAALDLLGRLGLDPRVRVMRIDAPFNFAALNNAAVRASQTELIAFINDDILVAEPDWLRRMALLAVRPDVGAVGAKLLYPNGAIQHAGVVLGMGPMKVAGHELRGAPGDASGPQARLKTRRTVSAVTAACLVLERRKFDAVGGFDEAAFPVAYNDVDLCLRLARKGYRTLWTPDARLMHLESATRGGVSAGDSRSQLAQEAGRMRKRWGPLLAADPFYNPNLTLDDERSGLADRSRATWPWR